METFKRREDYYCIEVYNPVRKDWQSAGNRLTACAPTLEEALSKFLILTANKTGNFRISHVVVYDNPKYIYGEHCKATVFTASRYDDKYKK